MNLPVFRRAFFASLLALLLLFGLALIDRRIAADGMDPLFPAAQKETGPPAGALFSLPPQAALLIPRPVRLLVLGAALSLSALKETNHPPEFENAKRV